MTTAGSGFCADDMITTDWRLDAAAYRQDAVFHAEMSKIFHSWWVCVGHVSEIPERGDYKTHALGGRPIIISRDAETEEIHVLYNRCRHRGAQVCQLQTGNATFFRCAYHGWTYANDGSLTGIPFGTDYYRDHDREELGLVPVAKVAVSRGFIFASGAPDVPDIDEYLGSAGAYLDAITGGDAQAIKVQAGRQRSLIHANWKLQLENTIDPYHFAFVHRSFLEIIEGRSGSKGDFVRRLREKEGGWRVVDLGNGHSVIDFRGADAGSGHGLPLGDMPFNLIIFPNLGLLHGQMRLVLPRATEETETQSYPMLIDGLDDEQNAARLRAHEEFYGPAGFGMVDDVEVGFDRVRQGLQAATEHDWVLLSRGADDERHSDLGSSEGNALDEVSQRAFYREWSRLLDR